jgi:hypothetical protein
MYRPDPTTIIRGTNPCHKSFAARASVLASFVARLMLRRVVKEYRTTFSRLGCPSLIKFDPHLCPIRIPRELLNSSMGQRLPEGNAARVGASFFEFECPLKTMGCGTQPDSLPDLCVDADATKKNFANAGSRRI